MDIAVERAESLAARLAQSDHAASIAYGLMHSAMFHVLRRNLIGAKQDAGSLSQIADEHQMALFITYSRSLSGWVDIRSGDRSTGLANMREGLANQREQFVFAFEPLIAGRLAEAEAESGEIDAAIATIDRALADTALSAQSWFDAELHRIRGEILLKLSPADSGPAEAAFLAAIAVARSQKARSFELRAALALAKLHQSVERPIEAHGILSPALESFAPTREFPEIEEAKALFGALAHSTTLRP